MSIEPGRSLLHYRLVEQIGEGGMGVVWKALDTTLDREVAIKILPEAFAADHDRLLRFEREAKLLASLSHPNIAGIYGLHTDGDVRFVAMELVQGEDLQQRLARGPLTVHDALEVAAQVARALEAAHAQGIVHRDLKPANIVQAEDGTIKVLDFGLAKALAVDPASGQSDPELSPTMTSAGTRVGMILGTAAYMSPEQARGKVADTRADLWAFGATLMEMLSGKQVFAGETISDILASVLKSEPDWDALPENTPRPVRRLLRRCLRKDPDRRLHHPADARLELEAAQTRPDPVEEIASQGAPAAPLPAWRRALPAVFGVVALLAVGLLAVREASRPGPTTEPVSYRFDLEVDNIGDGPIVSPDGARYAYIGREEGERRIFVRSFDEPTGRSLAGTNPGAKLIWSPDGTGIAYFTEETIERTRIDSGTVQTICRTPRGWRNASWSRNGTVLFEVSASQHDGWYVCHPGEMESEPLERPLPLESGQTRAHPRFLPDGEHFVFVQHVDGVRQAVLTRLGSTETTLLFPTDSKVEVAADGWYLFARKGQLLARAFDTGSFLPLGEPVKVAERVDLFEPNGRASFSVSDAGTVMFYTGQVTTEAVWFDRDGRELGAAIEPGELRATRLSPDGKLLALIVNDPRTGTGDLWVHDLERDIAERLTSTAWAEFSPRWSPDSGRIAYSADPEGPPNLFDIAVDGSDPRELTPPNQRVQYPTDWSSDGTTLLFVSQEDGPAWDIWTLDVQGEGGAEPRALLHTEHSERSATLSPDGRWIAYTSFDTDAPEVYVQPYGRKGARQRVSTDRGWVPQWDGNDRLFFRTRSEKLMAVTLAPDGDRLSIGKPRTVLELPDHEVTGYSLHPDGRILITRLTNPGEENVVKVAVGW